MWLNIPGHDTKNLGLSAGVGRLTGVSRNRLSEAQPTFPVDSGDTPRALLDPCPLLPPAARTMEVRYDIRLRLKLPPPVSGDAAWCNSLRA